MSSDLVATWSIALPDGKHKVEFEHGTTSGKRVIIVDGKVWQLPSPNNKTCDVTLN